MLTLNAPNKVTFTVNVQGTASSPTVRCVIGDQPGVIFPATSVSNGKFESIVELPKGFEAGSYPFKIEVLLNGRLFTPISTHVSVEGAATTVPEPKTEAVIPEIKHSLLKSAETKIQAQKIAAPKKAKPKALSRLESVVKAPTQKLKERATPEIKAISIASISNEVSATEPVSQPVERNTVVHEQVIPVTLVKGEIIYR